MKFIAAWAIALAFAINGPASSAQVQPPDLAARVQKLEKEVDSLERQSVQNTIRLGNLDGTYGATMTVADPGYSILRTQFGTMLLSLEKATPYADGVEILLSIGNSTGANFSGVKLSVDYGPAAPNEEAGRVATSAEWKSYLSARKHKDFDLIANILANRWNAGTT